jgi:hypothetical protein
VGYSSRKPDVVALGARGPAPALDARHVDLVRALRVAGTAGEHRVDLLAELVELVELAFQLAGQVTHETPPDLPTQHEVGVVRDLLDAVAARDLLVQPPHRARLLFEQGRVDAFGSRRDRPARIGARPVTRQEATAGRAGARPARQRCQPA